MTNQNSILSKMVLAAGALALLAGCTAHTGSAGGTSAVRSDPASSLSQQAGGEQGTRPTEKVIAATRDPASFDAPRGTGALTPAPDQPVELGGKAMKELQRIHFDFDSYALSSGAREVLGANAGVLEELETSRLVIEGHCDERGTSEYNLALGERRARSAYQYLSDLGVPAEGMGVVSFGEERPLAEGRDERAWAQNRRAEFVARMH